MKGLLQVVPGQYTDAGRPALVGRGMADPAHAGLVAGEESACNLRASRYNSAARISRVRYGDPVGPLATIRREPGQARKGAAVAVPSCAGVWLAGLPPLFPPPLCCFALVTSFFGFCPAPSRSQSILRLSVVMIHFCCLHNGASASRIILLEYSSQITTRRGYFHEKYRIPAWRHGTISIVSSPRGDTANQQILNVPNWASSGHRISLIFNDYQQD